MKQSLLVSIAVLLFTWGTLQGQSVDTVVVELAGSSKMVFTIGDRDDLEQLKYYDFQALFEDILLKLGNKDSLAVASPETIPTGDPTALDTEDVTISYSDEDYEEDYEEDYDDDDEDDEDEYDYNGDWDDHKSRDSKLRHSFNFDFGMNNYLENGNFPDADGAQYTVRPWGSWYVGLGSVLSMQLSRKFYVEMGLGVNWYNFKFEEDNTLVVEGDDGVNFIEDTRNASFEKSKLSMSYINASLVPMFDVGGYNHHSHFWHRHKSSFRIGLGPYAGYRLESHSKIVYSIDGDEEKDKESNNFYLNNFRYGLRLQFGVEGADFFINYDLNELFIEDKGPKLNAFSFGLIF